MRHRLVTLFTDTMKQEPVLNKFEAGWHQAYGLVWLLNILFFGFIFFPPVRTDPKLFWTFISVSGGLLLWQFVLWVRAVRIGHRLVVEYVLIKSHYVQALVQFCIYVYWGWNWHKVYAEAPLILSQIVFLYVFDALLSWSRGRVWRLGFGPFPVILSTNLFMWFRDDCFAFQFLMVATGVLGKEFIKWQRDGQKTHIFNPSAFALFIFSIALLFTGTSQYTWGWEIATTLARPHFIYLQIFLLGLIVQGFFRVTLMTFSATAALCLLNLIYTHITGVYFFVDVNIPIAVFLGLHLLMTDPATTPRSNIGKFIFGSLYGLGVWVCFAILRQFNLPEYYDKLLVVPFLNIIVQIIDRVAGWRFLGALSSWEMASGLRKLNFIYMGGWTVLFLVMLGTGFVQGSHQGTSVTFWQKAAEEGKPHAAENFISKLTLLAYSGNIDAANELGKIYLEGLLTKRDPMLAELFFAQARKLVTATTTPLTPELLGKLQTLLAHVGKDVDVPTELVGRLGFSLGSQPWRSRQVALSLNTQPGYRHSFSVSRDGQEQDFLISLRTPARFYVFRSHCDGSLAFAIAIAEPTGQNIALDSAEAQARLNQEYFFWSKRIDRLLSTIQQAEAPRTLEVEHSLPHLNGSSQVPETQ